MTQEQKAKAYDEALKLAKFYHGNCPSEPERRKLEKMFPMLRESKDDRIRKFLIQHISGWIGCIEHDLKNSSKDIESEKELAMFKAGLAYLEKQKESLPISETCKENADSFTAEEDGPFDEDEFLEDELSAFLQNYDKEYDDDAAVSDVARHFYEIGKKQKEQKPESCDCSRDEESYTNGIHHVLMNPEAYGLIKLKPAKWSEEFLRLMGITISQDGNQVCVLLGENLAEGIAGFGDTLADAVEEFKKEWRQFDRFRKTTWKPSEEQMEALNVLNLHGDLSYVGQQNQLISLYQDLKKLL